MRDIQFTNPLPRETIPNRSDEKDKLIARLNREGLTEKLYSDMTTFVTECGRDAFVKNHQSLFYSQALLNHLLFHGGREYYANRATKKHALERIHNSAVDQFCPGIAGVTSPGRVGLEARPWEGVTQTLLTPMALFVTTTPMQAHHDEAWFLTLTQGTMLASFKDAAPAQAGPEQRRTDDSFASRAIESTATLAAGMFASTLNVAYTAKDIYESAIRKVNSI